MSGSNPFKNEEIKEEIDINETVKSEDESVEEEQPQKNEKEEQAEQSEQKDSADTSDWQKKYDDLNQQYIRLAADFDNYRKRQAQEKEALIKFGTEEALKKLIEVLDNFERGQKSLENIDDCEKVKESFTLIQKQVYEALTKMGLEEIKAVGEEFDPNFHEAVMQTPSSDHKENTVIAELRKGYKYGDKVLRATMVNVASAE